MVFPLFLKACFIGIAIAAPVGPVGILCIRKTLEFGFWGAFSVGLGAALADGAYGAIAAFSLSAISQFLLTKMTLIKIIGGSFLLLLAYKEFKNSPFVNSITTKNVASFKLVIEVFFLTLSNPMTILAFIGVFASLNTAPTNNLESIIMVLGIIFGSIFWWLVLGAIVLKIKHKIPEKCLYKIKYIASSVLAGFGLIAIITAII